MRCAVALVIGLTMLALPACDRPKPSSSSASQANGISGPTKPAIRLTTLTPLLPNRQTHFVADAIGNIFWVQETQNGGNDVLFSLGSGAIPQATQLTSSSILSAMSAPRGATGNIQALAAAPDAGIYFFFAGGTARDVLACIGYFVSRTGEIRILAGTADIQAASGMKAALALARGQFISFTGSNAIWLWLSHTDGSAFLRFASRPVPAAGELNLRRPFRAITSNQRPIGINADTSRIGSGPEAETLVIADLFNGTLWHVDAAGEASISWPLVSLPGEMSSPTLSTAQAPGGEARTMLFVADAPPLKARSALQIAPPVVGTTYPALLFFGKTDITSIGRDDIQAYAGFPTYRMQLTEFVPEKGGKSWISYDESSGELLRVEIVNLPK